MDFRHITTQLTPTPEQKLLLQAALLNGPASLPAWHEWLDQVEMENLDEGSDRLLPLLYTNLLAQDVEHPALARFRVIYRNQWLKNRLLFNAIMPDLRAIHDAGLPMMPLKGAALLMKYYADYAQRPMNDFDLLVPPDRAQEAEIILKRRGWTPNKSHSVHTVHAREYRTSQFKRIDLHWSILPEACGTNVNQLVWKDALHVELNEVPMFLLNPSDQLLHICAHGMKWDAVPSIHWVADAITVLRTAPAIDWERVSDLAKQLGIVLRVHAALEYLDDLIPDANIPDAALDRMSAIAVSRAERWATKSVIAPAKRRNLFLTIWLVRHAYLRMCACSGKKPSLPGFVSYLRDTWEIPQLWQTPFVVSARVVQRIFRRR